MFRNIKFYIENAALEAQLQENDIPVFHTAMEAGENELVFTDVEEKAQEAKRQGACVVAVLTADNRSSFFDGIRYATEGLDGVDGSYLEKVYRRHYGLPWTILTTKRCVVREMTTADVERLYEMYAAPSVADYLEPLYGEKEKELDYTGKYIEGIYGFYGYGIWIIEQKDTGEVIGRAGIEHKGEEEGVELGYMIAAEYQGQGYAYEVCSAILDYAEEVLKMTRVYSYVEEKNYPSERLCEKLGFDFAGNRKLNGKEYRFFEKRQK